MDRDAAADAVPRSPGSAPTSPRTSRAPPAGAAVDHPEAPAASARPRSMADVKPYPLERKWDDVLPVGPPDRHRHGTLENGVTYHVMRTHKPKDRAALALAVDVGSIAEAPEECGVAHLVEHLAFRATENNDNFAIVRFLESIGAEFGACQNAYTSMDETVYELLVPIENADVLAKALGVFAEFATKVRVSDDDVEKERGAVMEEMRMGRDARGRASEAYWKILTKGSLYAERLHIGSEAVIREGKPEVFRRFYKKWYRPERMAVIAAGDFDDLDAVAEQIRVAFRHCAPAPGQPKANPVVRRPKIPPHAEPRIVCSVDKEHTKTTVTLTYKYDSNDLSTPGGYFRETVEDAFKLALDNRLYKLMRRPNPPFFSAGCSAEAATRCTTTFSLQIACEEGKARLGLEAGLRELARVRVHGFGEQELRIAKAKQMADAEQLFVERDQTYCTSLRDELVGHFLRGEFVVGAEDEARLTKACVDKVTLEDVNAFADRLRIDRSCVIRAMEGRATITEADVAAACETIRGEEARGEISRADVFEIPETLIEESSLPTPGRVVSARTFERFGFKQLTLANGMRVAMKRTDFLDDQVLIRAFARGGLSESPREQYLDSLYAATIAGELGMFGCKPEVLHDVMAGKRCDVSAKTGTYHRRVDADASPVDLETGMQLAHLLFTSDVAEMLVPEELEAVLRMQEQAIRNRSRDPVTVYNETIRHLVYGRSFQSKPLRVGDVRRMKPVAACAKFNEHFCDPAEFTVVLVGALGDEARLIEMVEKYLGSIPSSSDPTLVRLKELTPTPFRFPRGATHRDLRVPMVEPMAMASITFPINIPNPDYDPATRRTEVTVAGSVALTEEKLLCVFSASIIERRLLALLRFKFGEIYTCAASASFAYQDPAARGPTFRGDIMINFSCDPSAGHRLAALAMEDVRAMQRDGPTEEEVATAVEVETRALEVRAQENAYWREYFEAVHNSRLAALLDGDLDKLYAITERTRTELMRGLNPEQIRAHLHRCLDANNRVVVVLRPQRSWWARALLPDPRTAEGLGVLAVYGAAAGAFAYMRAKKKSE